MRQLECKFSRCANFSLKTQSQFKISVSMQMPLASMDFHVSWCKCFLQGYRCEMFIWCTCLFSEVQFFMMQMWLLYDVNFHARMHSLFMMRQISPCEYVMMQMSFCKNAMMQMPLCRNVMMQMSLCRNIMMQMFAWEYAMAWMPPCRCAMMQMSVWEYAMMRMSH